MAFKLGDFFPRQTINEPGLELDDSKWSKLEGGYRGVLYNASTALKRLQQSHDLAEVNDVYQELWNELHHQGDVGLASYYSVPHLTGIAIREKKNILEVLGLVSIIEIQRHKNNPKLPSALSQAYDKAIVELGELAKLLLNQTWNLEVANTVLTALAVSKGQIKLANAILNLDGEDVIDEFLEQY
jgi:hypothetical protein